jgi:hypothetical protein
MRVDVVSSMIQKTRAKTKTWIWMAYGSKVRGRSWNTSSGPWLIRFLVDPYMTCVPELRGWTGSGEGIGGKGCMPRAGGWKRRTGFDPFGAAQSDKIGGVFPSKPFPFEWTACFNLSLPAS